MDATRDYNTKGSKSKREIAYDITYMWNLKYDTNESIYTLTDTGIRPVVAKGRGEMRGMGQLERGVLPWEEVNNNITGWL